MTITSESSTSPDRLLARRAVLICGVTAPPEPIALGKLDFDLDRRRHLRRAPELPSPSDIAHGAADPSQALGAMRWQTHTDIDQVTQRVCEAAAASLCP
jgi:hypothetical protein